MHRDLIKRDLIQLDWRVTDQGAFFERMAAKLMAGGYVTDTYLGALSAREALYPTALPTRPEAVAIPHSDAVHVIEPFIASTRLAAPVTWHEMANNDRTHPVRFVFMLGFTKDSGHVEMLQILVESVQDPSFMERLSSARSEDEYHAALTAMPGLRA